ncbi:MAG TPA: fumarylacetoacetate hydrolase family protein [Pseudonocardiaceae bacterium]|jgi:acylpyruvate hydrolase|nr:fumarylacetoacetate hydrolase family protein [Pseudonocardiaceae bacterium]
MRLLTFHTESGTSAGRLDGDTVVELPYADVRTLLDRPDWRDAATVDGPTRPLDSVRLAPVVPRPAKIICVGLNYAKHIAEMGRGRPDYPTLFAKYALSLIGPYDPIVAPSVSTKLDWEVELGVVIGAPTRHVSPEDALAGVAGWTVFNDVSVRDWQNRTTQFLAGKTFESTTPVGPTLVTRDEISPDGRGLTVRCTVDDEVMQESNTDDLLFSAADIVSYLSQIVTLEPGDVIATGTPAGVAAGRQPAPWLRPGQTVVTEVEGVGVLRNTCVAEDA